LKIKQASNKLIHTNLREFRRNK